VNKKWISFRGQVSYAKMRSSGGGVIVLVCQLTKKVNKDEEVTYLSINLVTTLPL